MSNNIVMGRGGAAKAYHAVFEKCDYFADTGFAQRTQADENLCVRAHISNLVGTGA